MGALGGKEGLCATSLLPPLGLKMLHENVTSTSLVDLSSNGLQLIGGKACLENLTTVQANGICFVILKSKRFQSINKTRGKHFPAASPGSLWVSPSPQQDHRLTGDSKETLSPGGRCCCNLLSAQHSCLLPTHRDGFDAVQVRCFLHAAQCNSLLLHVVL